MRLQIPKNLAHAEYLFFMHVLYGTSLANGEVIMKEMKKIKEKKKPKKSGTMDKKDDMKKMVEKKNKKDCY